MPRHDWENALLRRQFPDYTDDIDRAFGECLRRDLDKQVIVKKLFKSFEEDLRHACVDAAETEEEEIRAASGELTNCDAVWDFLFSAFNFKIELKKMSAHNLASAYRRDWHAQLAIQGEEQNRRGAAADAFEFFNEPEADADFRFWLKVGAWTIAEAVALSLGKNPATFERMALDATSQRDTRSPFREEYQRRVFLLQRAQLAGELSDPLKRNEVIQWFTIHEVEIPLELGGFDEGQGSGYWKSKCLELEARIGRFEQEGVGDPILKSSKVRLHWLLRKTCNCFAINQAVISPISPCPMIKFEKSLEMPRLT